MVFATDPLQKARSEDAIIAFTWNHFIQDTSQPEWLLRLPMTKAVVRAMDTVTAFSLSVDPAYNIKDFYIAGASKRGWTTWTTAAVDKVTLFSFLLSPFFLVTIPNLARTFINPNSA